MQTVTAKWNPTRAENLHLGLWALTPDVPDVAAAAILSDGGAATLWLASNPGIPAPVQRALASAPRSEVRAAVLAHTTDTSLLRVNANAQQGEVAAIAGNTHTPFEVITDVVSTPGVRS